jgi:hypothetical protein
VSFEDVSMFGWGEGHRTPGLPQMVLAVVALLGQIASAEDPFARPKAGDPGRGVLSEQNWRRVDEAVDRGLEFLSTQQRADGSFNAPDLGQPGITSLCVLAFLARGHVPQEGTYGEQVARAIEFVLESQQNNGLLFDLPIGAVWQYGTPTHTAMYNHAIAGLMLGEVYGMTDPALKRNPVDDGAGRYVGDLSGMRSDADLSITAWQLMFLRSARNAEFEVPKEYIDEAMAYVRRSFEPKRGSFTYCRVPPGNYVSRAMAGSGIVSLSLGGEHETDIAKQAGNWILEHPFRRYNEVEHGQERYSVYYCSQAMFQLGDDFWARFFPRLVELLLENQQRDGSWPPELHRDGNFGNAYTTALMVLSLTPPYQILPIYQR